MNTRPLFIITVLLQGHVIIERVYITSSSLHIYEHVTYITVLSNMESPI